MLFVFRFLSIWGFLRFRVSNSFWFSIRFQIVLIWGSFGFNRFSLLENSLLEVCSYGFNRCSYGFNLFSDSNDLLVCSNGFKRPIVFSEASTSICFLILGFCMCLPYTKRICMVCCCLSCFLFSSIPLLALCVASKQFSCLSI